MRPAQTIITLACCAAPAAAQTPTYLETPVLYTQSPRLFEQIFRSANTRVVHALVLGDSQETCPGGHGDIYLPRLHAELVARYGPTPETPWSAMRSTAGTGAPWAEWLTRTWTPNTNLTVTGLATFQMPPGLRAGRSTSLDQPNINSNQNTGQIMLLQPRAESVNPGAAVSSGGPYFDTSAGVYLEVMALTSADDVAVRVRIRHCPTAEPNIFLPLLTTVTGPSLQSEAPGQFVIHRFGPFPITAPEYLEVELTGSRPDAFTDLVSAHFVSAAATHGWALTALAAGGYTTHRWRTDHSACGPVLTQLRPDVAILCFGANDVNSGYSPEAYQQEILDLIAFVRAATRPDLPIILIADPIEIGLPANLNNLQDRYAGACWLIAQQDPLVAALNSRLLLASQNWTYSGASAYLSDNVHYNAAGAALKAQLEINTLYTVWKGQMPPCLPDMGSQGGNPLPDGLLDNNDFVVFINYFFAGDPRADLGVQGGSPGHDGLFDNNDFVVFINEFFNGCP